MRIVLLGPLLAAAASAYTILYLNENEVCGGSDSKKWLCKAEKDCQGSSAALKRGWKPNVCSYRSGNEMILCCPPSVDDLFPARPGAVLNSTDKAEQLAWSGSWDRQPAIGWNIPRRPNPNVSSASDQARPDPWDIRVRPTARPPSDLTSTGKPIEGNPPKTLPPQLVGYLQLSHPAGSPAAKAQEMCKEYAKYMYRKEILSLLPGSIPRKILYCGKPATPLIFGGQSAEPYEFPHMARIGYGEADNIHYKCGGSLISERYILSAAHCATVDGREASWANLGDCNLNTEKDVPKEEVVTVRIVERIVHPDYNRTKNWYNDIALFRLEKDLKLGIYVRPACLNTRSYRTEKWLIASGWGLTKPYSPFAIESVTTAEPSRLQKVELKTIPTDVCNSAYSKLSEKDRALFMEGIRPHGMMCAGGVPGKAICNGDSGGPLQAFAPPCLDIVVGVASFGIGCKSSFPGVYTNVVDYLPWIVETVWG